MYWVQKRLLSQNFFTDRKLVQQLIRSSSIGPTDTVLEIGPGRGIITKELLKTAKKVIAVEKDVGFYQHLKQSLGQNNHLTLIWGDFLNISLPQIQYKVFSNIPFGITGDIVRKLLQSSNSPSDCYLVTQSEAASKFIAGNSGNSLAAVLYYPWWDIRISHRFARSDFSPSPRVDVVLLHIKQRRVPLLETNKELYQDFVTYHFIHDRFAKNVSALKWIQLLNIFLGSQNPRLVKSITGSFARLRHEQSTLSKIHRTRLDNNWKRF